MENPSQRGAEALLGYLGRIANAVEAMAKKGDHDLRPQVSQDSRSLEESVFN